MAVIDIIVIAVLLVFAIIGMVKGFLNTLLSLFSTLASFGVAIFCAKPVSQFLNKIFNFVGFIASKLVGPLTGTITPFETSGATEALTGAQVKEYFAADGLSFQERIFSLFIDDSATFEYMESAAASDQNVIQFIAEGLAAIISVIVSAILVFILIKIAVLLLSKLFNAITKIRAINGLDRTLGLLIGVIKASFLICLTLGVFYLLANSTVQGWIDNSTVTKWVYNYVTQLVDMLADKFNLPEFITTLFPSIGSSTPGA